MYTYTYQVQAVYFRLDLLDPPFPNSYVNNDAVSLKKTEITIPAASPMKGTVLTIP